MTPGIKLLIAGNWKMNGNAAALGEIGTVAQALTGGLAARADVMIAPPATLVSAAASVAKGTPLHLGAQDCHAKTSGAHTGDISAEMLVEAGASMIIVGHSERRADHHETDADVRAKAEAVIRAGALAIICVGETEAQRLAGEAVSVVTAQLDGSIPEGAKATTVCIAYEPVWAIGTGRTPTAADVEEIHGAMRANLVARFGNEGQAMRLLYGGSVKPSNAAELMAVANVDGALVGGASLKAVDFLGTIGA